MSIRNICIVGGGSSGWMTAASIARALPEIKVTLIESKNVKTIGVGESTLGHINSFMDSLGLKDEDWMKECNATYKTSIKFTDFAHIGETFHYPFGQYDLTDTKQGLMDWFKWKVRDPEVSNSNFAEFFHSSVEMIDQNKMTNNSDNTLRAFNFKRDTAYHMDAGLFGQYLKNNFCTNINHILDDVTEVNMDNSGSVKSLSTGENGELLADLFIDCTGFLSLLLEKALKVPFVSFNDTLLNDRALATQVPYLDKDKEMHSVTNCTGIEAGWVWNIPLYNRIGSGYVYSSKHATREEAESQFRKHLAKTDPKRAAEAKIFALKIRHGIHEKLWVKNVVGVGLSAGFIEPLESTGLMMTHEVIMVLLRTLSRREGAINQLDKDAFNFAVRDTMEGFRSFISQHYALSGRTDTPYWREVTQGIEYSKAAAEYKSSSNPRNDSTVDFAYRLNLSREFHPEMGGLPYIAAGSGYSPITKFDLDLEEASTGIKDEEWKDTKVRWTAHNEQVKNLVAEMPTHYQFLKNMYGDE